MKDGAPQKIKNDLDNQRQIKVAKYAIENVIQNFKPNFTLLNEIIYATVTYKQNSFKQPKWKSRKQKEIEEYRGKYLYLIK